LTKNTDQFCLVTFCSRSNTPEVEKCIKIDHFGIVLFWIFGKEFNKDDLNFKLGKNVLEFNENIKEFESIKICHGGPKASLFPKHPQSLCTVTSNGLLRHNECVFIIQSKSKYCDKCKILSISMNARNKRKIDGCEEKLDLSPKKMKKVNEIRKKPYAFNEL